MNYKLPDNAFNVHDVETSLGPMTLFQQPSKAANPLYILWQACFTAHVYVHVGQGRTKEEAIENVIKGQKFN